MEVKILNSFFSFKLTPEHRNYCVYSGRHLPENAMSAEHVIPRSLGGSGATVIRCSKAINSQFGYEIDAKIANDPMIIFGRRDADARGNSGKVPRVIWKRAAKWKRDEPFGENPAQYNIEVPGGNLPATVYDTQSGKRLPSDIFSDTGFVVRDLCIDSRARFKFVTKTLLGLGWKLFGENFLATGRVSSLREAVGIHNTSSSDQSPLYYLDPFLLAHGHPAKEPLRELEKRVARRDRTTALMRHTEFGFEWSVSCLGYFVGSMIYPTEHRLLPGNIKLNEGVLVTVLKDRLLFDYVDSFPSPWG